MFYFIAKIGSFIIISLLLVRDVLVRYWGNMKKKINKSIKTQLCCFSIINKDNINKNDPHIKLMNIKDLLYKSSKKDQLAEIKYYLKEINEYYKTRTDCYFVKLLMEVISKTVELKEEISKLKDMIEKIKIAFNKILAVKYKTKLDKNRKHLNQTIEMKKKIKHLEEENENTKLEVLLLKQNITTEYVSMNDYLILEKNVGIKNKKKNNKIVTKKVKYVTKKENIDFIESIKSYLVSISIETVSNAKIKENINKTLKILENKLDELILDNDKVELELNKEKSIKSNNNIKNIRDKRFNTISFDKMEEKFYIQKTIKNTYNLNESYCKNLKRYKQITNSKLSDLRAENDSLKETIKILEYEIENGNKK